MARIIGIRHRVKRTRENEARPTMVAIKDGDTIATHDLEDGTAELDFLLHRFPIAWRDVEPSEDVSQILGNKGQWLYHCKTRKVKEDEDVSTLHPSQVVTAGRTRHIVTKVPSVYEGLQAGDTVAMVLGGSGDRFAFALSRRSHELGNGTRVLRLTPLLLKQHRNGADKEDDHLVLVKLAEAQPDLFYAVGPRDRRYILAREAMRARRNVQKDRIKCDQRLLQRAEGIIFLSEEGRYPEGKIEDQYDSLRANDAVMQALLDEEKAREAELRKAVAVLDVWQEVFEPITGVGEVLAAGIITAVGDIRRFEVPPDFTGADTEHELWKRRRAASAKSGSKLKAYLGVHVLNGGKYADTPSDEQFPRKRAGMVANWQKEARQALYLLGDQFVKRPDSEWGTKLNAYKAALRSRHPEVVVVDGKKRFTPGHTHRMAIWRTLTRFVERLYRQWAALESKQPTA